jgi:hypothetical protein
LLFRLLLNPRFLLLPNKQVVLSPHLYPRSITGADLEVEDQEEEITWCEIEI